MFCTMIMLADRASRALMMTGDQQFLARHAVAALEAVGALLQPGIEIIESLALEQA